MNIRKIFKTIIFYIREGKRNINRDEFSTLNLNWLNDDDSRQKKYVKIM